MEQDGLGEDRVDGPTIGGMELVNIFSPPRSIHHRRGQNGSRQSAHSSGHQPASVIGYSRARQLVPEFSGFQDFPGVWDFEC